MLFKMIEEKKLDVRIYDTYPLSEVATAHTVSLSRLNPLECVGLIYWKDIESRKTIGKLLLKP